jgi:hypothetical protein
VSLTLVQECVSLEEALDQARAVGALGLDVRGARRKFLRRVSARLGAGALERVGRCEQVSRAAGRLAELMMLEGDTVEGARVVGLLHGLGACAGDEEASADLAAALGVEEELVRAVRDVGRRCGDGPGPEARVVRVAGVLEGGVGEGWSVARRYAEALAVLRRGRGTEFDPGAVVAAHLIGATAMAEGKT